jgi:hypothetical protein
LIIVRRLPADPDLKPAKRAVLHFGLKSVHCRRELRDVAMSCWMTNFQAIRWESA